MRFIAVTLTVATLLLGNVADAQVLKPDGPGPFPAVVLMHGCAGVMRLHQDWGKSLTKAGYVTLLVDSLGIGEICAASDAMKSLLVQPRIEDAYRGLDYLRTLSFVDGKRIAVMGWSHGAQVAVEAAADPRPDGFRAAVAMYPRCRVGAPIPTVPTLVLIGEYDDWTPADLCVALAKRAPLVMLKVYRGTQHHFDDPRYSHAVIYLGHKLEYNVEATRDATQRVLGFLGRSLSAGQ